MGKTRLWLAWLLVLMPALASAEVYRWVDDSGKVHFTDRPPAGQGEQVEIRPAPAAAPASPPAGVPDRQRLLDMYQHEREQRQEEQAEQARQRAERERECRRAANTLRRYQAGGPLYEDRPGGRYFFTAAEKDQEMAELRALLNKQCGGVPADLQPKGGR
jgi:hypothetical protein